MQQSTLKNNVAVVDLTKTLNHPRIRLQILSPTLNYNDFTTIALLFGIILTKGTLQ